MSDHAFTFPLTASKQAIERAEDVVERASVAEERAEDMATVEVGETPSEVVYEENKLELHHYEPESEEAHGTPILVVYALINRPYILDLQPNRSVIRRLLDRGFDVYLIDWGEPSRLDASLGIADYVLRYVHNCVNEVCEREDVEDVHLLGYCMGGTMSAMYAALYPERVRTLSLMAAGLCFDGDGGVLELWGGEGAYFDPESISDAYGLVPAEFFATSFDLMDPIANTYGKYVRLYENVEDEAFVKNFARMERWIGDGIDMAGRTYAEFIRDIYQENKLARGELALDGREVSLDAIDMPVLQIVGEYDHLVPPEASLSFTDLVASDDTHEINFPVGHIGLSVSSRSHEELWPEVAEWLAERSLVAEREAIKSIDGVGSSYAASLREVGVETPEELAAADPEELAERSGLPKSRVADWIAHINIKVDREELPAVDNYYMSAVQILSGSGGWPLNCFLTPDLKPYFGGTYFPPEDRQGRPSWKKVIERMSFAFKERYDEVMEQAEKLSKLVEQGSSRFVEATINIETDSKLNVESWIHTLQKELDFEEGGLKSAPKFPSPHIYSFILNYSVLDENRELRDFLKRTAHAFIDGGLFDPVHGGFARYCVDDQWRVPHFEKMLYDNAGILTFLARMQSFFPEERWKWAMERTLDFWTDKMMSDEELFFSAVDADSEGEEGKYYTWSMEELRSSLSKDELSLLMKYAEISENGNWEGTNILSTRPEKRADFFKAHDHEQIDKVLNQLKEKAKGRVHPGIDDKILVDWNAMMVSALLNVSRYANIQPAQNQALKTLAALEDKFVDNAEIKGHVYKNHKTYSNTILDDYAYLIAAYLDAYENTFEEKYLSTAEKLCRTALDHFTRKDHPLMKISGDVKNEFIARQPMFFDSPYPCGNSVMAHNLRKLGIICDHQEWKDKAHEMMTSLEGSVGKFPTSFAHWADLGFQMEEMESEIVLIGPQAREWAREIASSILPAHIMMAAKERTTAYPLLDRSPEKNKTAIYLCQNYACQKPVHSLQEFTNLRSQTLSY